MGDKHTPDVPGGAVGRTCADPSEVLMVSTSTVTADSPSASTSAANVELGSSWERQAWNIISKAMDIIMTGMGFLQRDCGGN